MVRSNCDPKKPTLLGIHDYWTGVPTTFDLHCRYSVNDTIMDMLKLKQNLLITVNHLLTNVTLCCMKLVINIPDAYSVYFFSLQLKVLLVCLGDLVSHFMMLSEEQWWIICIVSARVLLTSLFQGGLISPTPRRIFTWVPKSRRSVRS